MYFLRKDDNFFSTQLGPLGSHDFMKKHNWSHLGRKRSSAVNSNFL